MKRFVALLSLLAVLFGLCACGVQEPAETTEPAPDHTASQAEIDKL